MSGWSVVRDRLGQVGQALSHDDAFVVPAIVGAVKAEVMRQFPIVEEGSSYLLLCALTDRIPTEDEVIRLDRQRRIDRDARSIVRLADSAARAFRVGHTRKLKIETGVTVDVTDTVKSGFTTGIQRVVRETISRWAQDRDISTVRWDRKFERLMPASLSGVEPSGSAWFIVPFDGVWVLPEIAVEEWRAKRIAAIASCGRMKSIAIGHDCIPLTTAEVAGPGMPGAFSRYLTALSRFSLVATTSGASETEYRGWKRMLSGAGLLGPEIARVGLAFSPGVSSAESLAASRVELGIPNGAMVLAVGSHEPRKNHLMVVAAAENLWQEGLEFSLVMVGGNSWDAAEFAEEVDRLRRLGRSIVLISNARDELIWGLYRAARVTIFPSLNEGFGLPVVESLASGTPVITSNFGAMRELGESSGALLVDPWSESDVARGLRAALTDDALHRELVARAATLRDRSWDDYAAELWTLVAD